MRYVCFAILLGVLAVTGCKETNTNIPAPPTRADSVEIFRKAFTTPEDCKTCHPKQYEDWSMSMHAYAMVDPVFFSLNKMGQDLTNHKLDQFCVACHSPFATLLGEAPNGIPNTTLSPISRGGVTCENCHRATSHIPGHPISTYRLDNTFLGPLRDAQSNSFHKSQFDTVFHQGIVCAGCHDVINPRGIPVEQTFTEWQKSDYPGQGIPCQVCHMKWEKGSIAVGGPPDRMVHSHIMEGVDVPLVDFPNRDKMIEKVAYALQYAVAAQLNVPATITRGKNVPITYNIYNQITGHNIPSGTIFERQMWVEAVVTNENGDTLFTSGFTDPNGDLLNQKSDYVKKGLRTKDTSLVLFNGTAYRLNQEIDFFFDADAVVNRTIPPFQSRFAKYILTPSQYGSSQEVTVHIRLLFRAMPPYLLRMLGHADLIPKMPTFVMEEAEEVISIK
ncbi:MAG: hypothetical protein JNJ85_06145 [Candidatus Kapabacteria bacterium]|nr:hypothetical protein [Candidatus Kapabacteria bacterium]